LNTEADKTFSHSPCLFHVLTQVEDEVGEISMVIVQNKIDLIDDAVVEP